MNLTHHQTRYMIIGISLVLLAGFLVLPGSAISSDSFVPRPENGDFCWNADQAQEDAAALSREGFQEFIDETGKGSGFFKALFPMTDTIEYLGFRTFQVAAGSDAHFQLALYSPEDPQTVRFSLLHNEQQIDINEADPVPYRDVQMTDEAIYNFDVMLDDLETGVHDVVVMYSDEAEEPAWPFGTLDGTQHRFTIIVGDPDTVDIAPLTFDTWPTVGSLTAGDRLQTLSFTLDDTTSIWSAPEPAHQIPAGEALDFNILTGYFGIMSSTQQGKFPEPEFARFALTMLVDYEQVPITAESDILYGKVGQDAAYTRIPLTLPAFEEPESHDISMIQIDNPRVPMCLLWGPEFNTYSSDVTHMRVALDVVESDS